MNVQTNSFRNIGNILYLPDSICLSSSTSSATATEFVSVDSRFTITSMGLTANYTDFAIQVNNNAPFLDLNPYNQNLNYFPGETKERVIVNPDFENSWCNIGNLSVSGTFEGTGFYRFIRISNVSGISTAFKAFIFAEKLIPVIQ